MKKSDILSNVPLLQNQTTKKMQHAFTKQNNIKSKVHPLHFSKTIILNWVVFVCDIYDLDIKVQFCKHSDFQVGRDKISHDRKYFSHVNLDLEPRTLKVKLA